MARLLFAACSALLLATQAAADTFPYSTYRTAPYTPPQIKVTKSGQTDPGYIFVGPRGNQPQGTAALIYDEDGHLVYQGPEEVTANFKVQKLFNEDVITFWAGNMMDLGFGYGTVHILDNTYREIYTVTLQDNFVSPDGAPRDSYIDLHESHVTDRNTLLVTAYNVTQHDLSSIGGKVDDYMLDGMFFEIDIATNEIVYQWSALDHLQDIPLEASKQGLGADQGTQDKPWDAYHINSVELMDEGYIISLRHYWSGFYVHNNGSVMWQLSVSGIVFALVVTYLLKSDRVNATPATLRLMTVPSSPGSTTSVSTTRRKTACKSACSTTPTHPRILSTQPPA